MIEALFSQTNYVATKKLLDATVLRHEAIASNLANVETPNYKRIDVDASFNSALHKAMNGADPRQLQAIKPSLHIDTQAVASRRDGNTVELEKELMHLNQNTLAHAFETQMVSGTFAKLRMAITGQRG